MTSGSETLTLSAPKIPHHEKTLEGPSTTSLSPVHTTQLAVATTHQDAG